MGNKCGRMLGGFGLFSAKIPTKAPATTIPPVVGSYYFDRCPRMGPEYPLIDRLVRKGRQFFLIEGPELGEREVVKPISLGYAFQWLRELPEQIERTVITGGLAA
jgi:hypothetical protein